jgi:hypothetical protein
VRKDAGASTALLSGGALAARADLSVALRVAYFILQRSRASPALEDELAADRRATSGLLSQGSRLP